MISILRPRCYFNPTQQRDCNAITWHWNNIHLQGKKKSHLLSFECNNRESEYFTFEINPGFALFSLPLLKAPSPSRPVQNSDFVWINSQHLYKTFRLWPESKNTFQKKPTRTADFFLFFLLGLPRDDRWHFKWCQDCADSHLPIWLDSCDPAIRATTLFIFTSAKCPFKKKKLLDSIY